MSGALVGLSLVSMGPWGCQPPSPKGQAWPEADGLFHRDPRWLGGDGAYSVPLEDGRILWLFGDTFVAKTAKNVRSESTMVRNTIAIQRGDDPTRATMTFHWKGAEGAPASFFAEDGDRWYWPAHGIRLGPALVLFLQRVRPTPNEGLGFAAEGWRVALVDDASGAPDGWKIRILGSGTAPPGIAVGGGVVRDGDWIVALAQREPGDHAGFLVRWREDDLRAGLVDRAEWWGGSGWGGPPAVMMGNAGAESSVHRDGGRWMHVRSDGFGATNVVVSYASSLEGPWSLPEIVFRPPESSRTDAFVYAAKAHPELSCGGATCVTYATNTMADFATLVNDTSLYYPRFVKIPQ